MSREAWLAWSALTEPAHPVAAWLRQTWGAQRSWEWVHEVADKPSRAVQLLTAVAAPRHISRVMEAAQAWTRRLEAAAPQRLMDRGLAVGAHVVTPADPQWPTCFADLGERQPCALWLRGTAAATVFERTQVAVVGARSATSYGTHMAHTLAYDLATSGAVVVSGGAYGIDAAAHRGALAAGGTTVAMVAGGVDRLYPAGNADLLERVMEAGAVVSESPPGYAPHRQRFLSRNRLIAQAHATVVVEAAMRSGALSTARHASEAARPVGAVPGPVTSPSSSGCHALIRDAQAVLVTSSAQVMELVGPLRAESETTELADGDFATTEERQAYDALGLSGSTIDQVVSTLGVPVGAVARALGALEARGVVSSDGSRWRRLSGKSKQTRSNTLNR